MAAKIYFLSCDDFPEFEFLIPASSNKEALREAEKMFREYIEYINADMPDKAVVEVEVYTSLLFSREHLSGQPSLTLATIVKKEDT